MEGSTLTLVEYDPCWPSTFEMLRQYVTPALSGIVKAIEHVGSTSVPGLISKPIIDMDAVVTTPDEVQLAIQRLMPLGYVHEGDLGVTGREAFISPGGLPAHHLYVTTVDNTEYQRHMLFRDYLRSHPEDAKVYGELKMKLAKRFSTDRESYTAGKRDFVHEILRRAGWK